MWRGRVLPCAGGRAYVVVRGPASDTLTARAAWRAEAQGEPWGRGQEPEARRRRCSGSGSGGCSSRRGRCSGGAVIMSVRARARGSVKKCIGVCTWAVCVALGTLVVRGRIPGLHPREIPVYIDNECHCTIRIGTRAPTMHNFPTEPRRRLSDRGDACNIGPCILQNEWAIWHCMRQRVRFLRRRTSTPGACRLRAASTQLRELHDTTAPPPGFVSVHLRWVALYR